jgi:RNA polymerase sigma factor (sigma-70 family)
MGAVDDPVAGGRSEVAEGSLVGTDFVDCYQTHYRRLIRALELSGADHATAQDVAQEAFARAFARWRSVSKGTNPAGYVYTTAFRLFRRGRRRSAWLVSGLGLRHRADPESTGSSPQPDVTDDVRAGPSVEPSLSGGGSREVVGLPDVAAWPDVPSPPHMPGRSGTTAGSAGWLASARPTESAALTAVAVETALAAMPPRRRSCAVMCLVLGLSVHDAAVALRIADGTVRKHLEEARGDLRAACDPTL